MSHDRAADSLERFFRRLVANLSALDPSALHRPIAVADIHERLVPYRTHRAALGLDTGEDYEMTVLRLLAGEGGYALLFPEDLREAIAREVASTNPDTSFFRNFPDATVLLEPEKMEDYRPPAASRQPEQPPERAAAKPAPPPMTSDQGDQDERDLPFLLDEEADEPAVPTARPREIAPVTAPCQYCGGNLPVGRTVLFCPHCGQNVGVVHCPTCGSELDVGWEFCISCGQKVTGI